MIWATIPEFSHNILIIVTLNFVYDKRQIHYVGIDTNFEPKMLMGYLSWSHVTGTWYNLQKYNK